MREPGCPGIAVIVPVHNRLEFTKRFIESLFANRGVRFRLFIVDDGSTDGTAEFLKTIPQVRVFYGDGNFWWTKCVNLALRAAREEGFDYVLTLNNDVVLPPDYLTNLLAIAKAHPHSIIASQNYDLLTGRWHSSGVRRDWWLARDVPMAPLPPGEVAVLTHVGGRGTLIPMEVFDEVGLYDEAALPHYGADEDLTYRAASRGWKVLVAGSARLSSHVDATGSTGFLSKTSLRNLIGYLTHIKSPCNLRNRYVICRRHCRPRWYWPIAFSLDVARVVTGYFIRSWRAGRAWAGAVASCRVPEGSTRPRLRIALLTNILAPYRVPTYREFARLAGHLTVFLSGWEDNRKWQSIRPEGFLILRTRSIILKTWSRRFGSTRFDRKYLHLPVGTLPDLIRFRPHAIISTEMGLRTACALLYHFVAHKPLAVWWGGTLHTEEKVGSLKHLARRLFFARVVPAWISYGTTSTEYLTSLGVPRQRIFEATNCTDHTFFQKEAPASLNLTPKPVILFVGSFVPRKGGEQLIAAVEALQRRGWRFSTLLVGDGPEEVALRRKVEAAGLANVTFHPFVQQEQLPGIYRSADLLVFPTLEDVWGLVVNEALASGLPVMCSKYAGCARDLVPESWQFDPLDLEGSFVPALEMALSKGRAGRAEFIPASRMKGPPDSAKAIWSALSFASAQMRCGRHFATAENESLANP